MTDSERAALTTSIEPLGLILGEAEDHMMIKDIFWNELIRYGAIMSNHTCGGLGEQREDTQED